jgi:hypothetical protein
MNHPRRDEQRGCKERTQTMGLREWWDKLTGKKDDVGGERGYRAGSAPEPASDPDTNRDAFTDAAGTVSADSTDDDDTKRDGRSG